MIKWSEYSCYLLNFQYRIRVIAYKKCIYPLTWELNCSLFNRILYDQALNSLNLYHFSNV